MVAIVAIATVLGMSMPASADYNTENYRTAADASAALVTGFVNAVNACDVAKYVFDAGAPIYVECNGDYDMDASSNGGSASADVELLVCVGTTCVTIPAELNRTGGYLDVDAAAYTGRSTLITVPRVCVTGICVNEEPQEISSVDLNDYFVEMFAGSDEVEIYHPFSPQPIDAQVGAITIDGRG